MGPSIQGLGFPIRLAHQQLPRRFGRQLLDGTNGFALNGIATDDYSGARVSGAGDINGDGIDDIIVGARNADPNGNESAGQSSVAFGARNGLELAISGV